MTVHTDSAAATLNPEQLLALAHIGPFNRGLFNLDLDFLGPVRDGVDYKHTTDGLIRSKFGYYRLFLDESVSPPRKLTLFAFDGSKLSGDSLRSMEDVYVLPVRDANANSDVFYRDIQNHTIQLQIEILYKLSLHMGTPQPLANGKGWLVPATNGQIAYSIEEEEVEEGQPRWAVHLHTRFDVKDEANKAFVTAKKDTPPTGFSRSFYMPSEDGTGERRFHTPNDAFWAVFEDWNKRAPHLFARRPVVGQSPENEAWVSESFHNFMLGIRRTRVVKRATVAGGLSAGFTVAAWAAGLGPLETIALASAFATGVAQEPAEQSINGLVDLFSAESDEHVLAKLAISERDLANDYVDKSARNYDTRVCKPIRPDEELKGKLKPLTQEDAGIQPANRSTRAGFSEDWIDRLLYTAPFRSYGWASQLIHKDCAMLVLPNGIKWMMVNRRDDRDNVNQTDVYIGRSEIADIKEPIHELVEDFLGSLKPGEVRKITQRRGGFEVEAHTLSSLEFQREISGIIEPGAHNGSGSDLVKVETVEDAAGTISGFFMNDDIGLNADVDRARKPQEAVPQAVHPTGVQMSDGRALQYKIA